MELPKGIAKHMVVETPPDPQPVPVDPNSSYSVYASPEFKAFCKALGIAHGLLTHDLVIVLERDAPVRVYQCYRPDPKRQVVETTSHGTDTPTG